MPVPGSPHGSPGIENSGRVSILPIRKSAPKKRIEMALLVQIPPILRRRHRPRSLHNSAQLCITTHENNRTNPKKGGHQGEHKAKPANPPATGGPHRQRPRTNPAQLCITTHENNRTNPKKGGHQGEHKAKPANPPATSHGGRRLLNWSHPMLWSKLFIPTLRDNPAEAEVASHQLLLRAGYIRQVAAGIYSYLFLAQRSLLKIIRVVREEMDAIGAQEMLLPALNPAELWQESGRWDVMGDNMFRLKDRFQRDLCLAMTHEEVITATARGELRSYKQLPQIWYQIQTKFRDEPRPKSGLGRVRQFIMKDSYSFDMDAAGLDAAYRKHYDAYCRIFERCGLEYLIVEAHSGAMGGSQSHEFMVESEAGEDFIVMCRKCGYAANREKAAAHPSGPAAPDPEGDLAPEEFHTPGRKTIAEVSAFTGLPESSQMKSLVLVANGKPL